MLKKLFSVFSFKNKIEKDELMIVDLRIVAIQNDSTGENNELNLNNEYIAIANKGNTTIDMTNWVLTDWRPGHQHIHKYTFQRYLDDCVLLRFSPGEHIILITGHGTDIYVHATDKNPPQIHLYWEKDSFVWNNCGDIACLYNNKGELVSKYTVP